MSATARRFTWEDGDIQVTPAPLKEFNPNHDSKGRFATGGGGTLAPSNTLRMPEPTGAPGSVDALMGKPGYGSRFSPSQVAEVRTALADALVRNPTLTNPANDGYKLMGVTFASSDQAPAGVDQFKWLESSVYMQHAGAEAITDYGHSPNTSYIVINDMKEPALETSPGTVMPADGTVYGEATHELGHAWAASNGVENYTQAAGAMEAADISPYELRNGGGSFYGASDPREGIAELYSQAYSPASPTNDPAGLGRPGLGDKFDALVGIVKSGPGTRTMASGRNAGAWLVVSGPMLAQIKAAAEKNIAAKAWVASSPFLDGLSKAPLKEFNPNHDEHGRFTFGDGSSSSATDAVGRVVGTPGADSKWTASQQAGVRQAVAGELSRHPEMATGPHALQGVNYLSGPKPAGVTDAGWNSVQYDMRVANPDTVAATMHEPGQAGPTIVVNDTREFPNWTPGLSADANQTSEGVVTHELGHAYMLAHTDGTFGTATELMNSAGLDPMITQASTQSYYAATDPREGFAELYAQRYAGSGITGGVINQRFDGLLERIGGMSVGDLPDVTPPKPPAGWTPPSKLVLAPTPANEAQIRAAAQKNLAAGKWVASLPALDAYTSK